jgi:hypothetical protein
MTSHDIYDVSMEFAEVETSLHALYTEIDSYLSPQDLAVSRGFATVGEYGLALEAVADSFVETQTPPSGSAVILMEKLAVLMRMESSPSLVRMRALKDLITYSHLQTESGYLAWLEAKVNEARRDPVGLWQIVKGGRERFRVSGAALEDFVFRTIVHLVQAGAKPIAGDKREISGWQWTQEFGTDPEGIGNAVIAKWKVSGGDPDFGDVWFAFKSAV